ncbi:MAG: ABC transporter permease [Chloroflexi bacterium]|nr:ABC transporter permease [Chloroflexota bacterium]
MSTNLTHSPETFDTDALQTHWGKIREIFRYRYLLRNLVVRDLKVRYKNSILGVLWSLLNPLLMMVVYTVLFTVLFGGNQIRQYPIFILVALIPWQLLAGSIVGGTVSITSNAPLIKKVYFPRVLLPASRMLSMLVNFAFALLVLIILLYLFGIGLTVHALWVPFILLTQIVFMLGLMFIFATLQAFYRDTMMILEVAMLAWFFMTPIFYPYERFSEYAELMGIGINPARWMRWLNPMASIVDSYRTVLWGNVKSSGPVSMDPLLLLRTFVTAVIILVIGYLFFIKMEYLFGEKL